MIKKSKVAYFYIWFFLFMTFAGIIADAYFNDGLDFGSIGYNYSYFILAVLFAVLDVISMMGYFNFLDHESWIEYQKKQEKKENEQNQN